jgi:hypothetical protein
MHSLPFVENGENRRVAEQASRTVIVKGHCHGWKGEW